MKRALTAFTALLFCTLTQAQLTVGDVGVTGFLANQFTVLHANGTSTVFVTGAFGGISHALLFDPTQPGSFLIGGVGFLGRVTVTGPTTAVYTPITSSVGVVSQMSFSGTDLIVCDSGTDQILIVNPATGNVAPVVTGPQPWGTDLNAAVIDPNTGDIYAGGNNGIWRIPALTTTPLPFASGWAAGMSIVSGLAINPFTFQPAATLLTVNRFASIAPGGTLTDISPPGAMPGPNFVDVDHNGDFVVGASFGQIYRVPNAGGAPVLIGTASGILGAATSVACVVTPFTVTATPFGVGGMTIAVAGIPPGIVQGFTVPSFDVSLPVGTGPIFGFQPDGLSISLVLAFPAPAPGNVVHWTWPATFPDYPALPFLVPPGTLAPGATLDLLVVGFNGLGSIRAAPVVRITVN